MRDVTGYTWCGDGVLVIDTAEGVTALKDPAQFAG